MLADMRHHYPDEWLNEANVAASPIEQFQAWLMDAIEVEHSEANAMTLATTGADGKPSARMVLLKGVDENGFVFHTNYDSPKAQDIAANPQVALVFYWGKFPRQVRVEGTVDKISPQESDAYFASRPRDSQLGAWASPQSQVIASRSVLEERQAQAREKYGDGPIPRPSNWGGYRVKPTMIEFWQGRPGRMHDRLRYEQQADGSWHLMRLAP